MNKATMKKAADAVRAAYAEANDGLRTVDAYVNAAREYSITSEEDAISIGTEAFGTVKNAKTGKESPKPQVYQFASVALKAGAYDELVPVVNAAHRIDPEQRRFGLYVKAANSLRKNGKMPSAEELVAKKAKSAMSIERVRKALALVVSKAFANGYVLDLDPANVRITRAEPAAAPSKSDADPLAALLADPTTKARLAALLTNK